MSGQRFTTVPEPVRRGAGHRFAVLTVVGLLGLTLAACGEEVRIASPAPSDSHSPSPTAGAQPSIVLAYLARAEKLGVAGRQVTVTGGAVATAAMTELLQGPTQSERDAGLTTEIPSGTTLHNVTVSNGTATVDLSGRYDDGGGSLSMSLRVAQVVDTLTQFPTVRRVAFKIDGEPVEAIGGEGLIVDPPVGREDTEGVTPQVLVESLWPGREVTARVPFSGTANTFEAVVRWQVEKPDGTLIGQGTTMATSGTGTRGTFRAELDLGNFQGPAVVLSGGGSGMDGSWLDLVRIPITVKG